MKLLPVEETTGEDARHALCECRTLRWLDRLSLFACRTRNAELSECIVPRAQRVR